MHRRKLFSGASTFNPYLDLLFLGLFAFGQPNLQNTILKHGLDFVRINLRGQGHGAEKGAVRSVPTGNSPFRCPLPPAFSLL